MISHHPSIEILNDYAAGSLRLSHALCVATHVETCDECKQHSRTLTQMGAELFTEPGESVRDISSPVNETFKNKIFDMLDQQEPVSETNTPTAVEHAISDDGHQYCNLDETAVPRSLRQFIPEDIDSLNWVSVSPSLKVASLLRDKDGSQIALTRVKAGAKMAHHRHLGDELTHVLKGSFSDEDGVYRPGDMITRGENHNHKPQVTKDSECICLTVLDAPIQFTGFFSRWFNPLLRRSHSGFA